MKKIVYVLMIVLLGSAFSLNAYSEEHNMGPQVMHTKDFEKMKELAGVWESKVDMGKGLETLRVTYELTSAGNAIVERFAAGKPHEMVTVYYDFNGKLTMTHYCSIGNQPHMELTNPWRQRAGVRPVRKESRPCISQRNAYAPAPYRL